MNANAFCEFFMRTQTMENHMAKTLQKGFIVIGAVAALVIGAAGVANADWDDGWHRGWHHRWLGHYAYYPEVILSSHP